MRRLLIFLLLQSPFLMAQNVPTFKIVEQPKGITLGYAPSSGVKILKVGDLSSKTLTETGHWINMKTGVYQLMNAPKIFLQKCPLSKLQD